VGVSRVRPQVSPFAVVRSGAKRLMRAPALWAGACLATLVAALPMLFVIRGAVSQHLDASLEAAAAVRGANHDWMLEFGEHTAGVASTLGASVLGFAATLDTVSALLDGTPRPPAVWATVAVGALVWTFLSGGIIDRYARDRVTGARGFFQACGASFWPLSRLALLAAIVYGALFFSWRPWLLSTMHGQLTRDVSVERTAILMRLVGYVVFLVSLAVAHLIFDYAKVRLVVEERRSAFGAWRAAAGLVRRHARGTIAVYAWNVAVLALVMALYSLVDLPGRWGVPSLWAGVVVGQAYLAARIGARLLFWASEVEWFERQLAHVRFIAPSLPSRPEPPIVERITGSASSTHESQPHD